MVKKFPVVAAPEFPLAPAADPLWLAANPMANEALFACVCDVLVWLDVPVVPPGVVCEVPVAAPVFCPAPAVVPAVTPMIADAPLLALFELDAPWLTVCEEPTAKVSEAAWAAPARAKNATVERRNLRKVVLPELRAARPSCDRRGYLSRCARN